ncbi:MAG: hypothetical protein H0U66_06310 [Gemmatimonadaceae bacterium]|nr:hypothetical protein [Gemmatimonadaceae bacterium]
MRPPRGRRFYLLVTLAVAALHSAIFLSIWGALMAHGDFYGSRAPRSPALEYLADVLAAPLFYIPEHWWLALRPVLDDSAILILQAILNGVVWGAAVASLLYYQRRRLDRKQRSMSRGHS